MRKLKLAIAATFGLLVAACQTPQTLQALPPDPVQVERVERATPLAKLDSRGYEYVGPLPTVIPSLAEDNRDFLGDVVYYDTQSAIDKLNRSGQNGEQRIRRHVPQLLEVCGRVMLTMAALDELDRQNEHVEDFNRDIQKKRGVAEGISYAGMIGGAFQAWSAFGQDYGLTYVLGNLLPGLSNQYVYSKLLDLQDLQVVLWTQQNRLWINENRIWLVSMNSYCPVLVDYVAANGQLVQTSVRYNEPISDARNY